MHRYVNGNHGAYGRVDLGLEANLQRVLVHSLADVKTVARRLEDWMRLHGYPWKDIFAVLLALHEAASNAVCHGNRRDPAKCVRISFHVTPTEVLVGVEDQGQGFDLDLVARTLKDETHDRPGGRGLFLMQAYCTWVSFDPPGNRVILCRRRSS
jgi:anti-sigma regulatory factor (Ser/Thr protein kinase)